MRESGHYRCDAVGVLPLSKDGFADISRVRSIYGDARCGIDFAINFAVFVLGALQDRCFVPQWGRRTPSLLCIALAQVIAMCSGNAGAKT